MTRTQRENLFQQWLEEHRGLLAKVIRSFASDPEDQRDLYQEIAGQLWVATPQYAGAAAVSTWIHRVALNAALTWRRRDERSRRGRVLDIEIESVAGRIGNREESELEHLYAEIRRLEPLDRSLVLLHLEGLSYAKIGEALGISEGNVGVRLTRCRKRLSERMADR